MYKTVLFLVFFIALVPIVWRIVNRTMNRVSSAIDSPGHDADALNKQKQSFIENCIRKKNKSINEADEAQKAIDSLK